MLVVPASALVRAFDAEAEPLFDLVTSNAREATKLAGLRDYLLPRLLSGEVRLGV